MHIQKYLRGGGSLDNLTQSLSIKVKRHPEYPNLVMLKYDQINSPMADPLVQEARGVILNEDNDWDVVARPFDKFFNIEETLAADVDWGTACVQEKLDGSLMILYHYDGRWVVASSGTPDAGGPVGSGEQTFRTLFWRVWIECYYDIGDLDVNNTYMFELCTRHNQVVVPHDKNRLVLLGARANYSGQELSPLRYSDFFEVVKHYPITSEAELRGTFASFDGLDQEGYVVCDSQFRRVKVKHPRYVLFHHMVGGMTQAKLLDVVRGGELPEVLAYFPTWKADADQLRAAYDNLVVEANTELERVKDIPVQKDFALAIAGSRHRSAMFAVRAGKYKSVLDFYNVVKIDTLVELLKIET